MRRWSWLVAVAAAALAERGLQARGALLYPDGYQYLLMAKGIAAHGRPIVTLGHGGDTWLPSADASLKPLFPALVALLHLTGLQLELAARVLTAVAGASVCTVSAALARRLTGSTAAGLGAAALCLASPALSEWSAYSGPDPLAQALALGAALSLCARRPALAGVLGGLCVATRPEYALLALPLCLLRPRFGVAALASLAVVVAAVRPPLAFHAAAGLPGGAGGIGTLLGSDWPLLVLAGLGLASAPRRAAVYAGGAIGALAVAYAAKNSGSARYFAQLLPACAVLAAWAIARRRIYAVGALAAAALLVAAPRVVPARSDVFHELAPALRSGGPLVTAAPDAYGVLLSRPVRFLRPGARGLIVLDAAQRAYQPHIEYRGTIVSSLADRRGFVRPDGSLDERGALLVRGTIEPG